MPDTAAKPTRRYAAFVSYRHADNRDEGRRWAEWLHQSLETYEVPRDLVGKPNLRGSPVPAALYPVFRDEEELSADADLSQNLRRALENTEVLIVLCSPRASASPFVEEEIRYFKELGKSDRILALMIDGEPNADDPAKAAQGITPAMECFPQPLRFGVPTAQAAGAPGTATIDWTQRTEPLAADVRPQNRAGQGYTSGHAYRAALEKARAHSPAEVRRLEKAFAAQLDLARLKLIAGALGLPLGQLRERDAVYRAKKFRRLAAVLGSLALLALIAAGVAVWQGVVAKRQQARAEAGERVALAARERAVSAKNAADELIRYMQYDLRDTLGKLGALDMMDDINARIRRYHDEHPPESGDQNALDNADRERAVALDQQGTIQLSRGSLAEALKSFEESLAIRRKFAAQSPDDPDLQRDMSVSLVQAAEVQKAQGNLSAALKSYQESLVIRRKFAALNAANANWQYDVSTNLDNLGDMQKAIGNLSLALDNYQDSLAIRRRLAALRPEDARWQHSLATSYSKLGAISEAKGNQAEALKDYQDEMAITQKLAAQDPSNADWQRDLSVSFDKIGFMQKAKGDLPAALASYRRSLDLRQKLVARDPSNALWQRDLSVSFDKVGSVQQLQKDLPAALQSGQASLDIRERLARQDPSNTGWQQDLAVSLSNLGVTREAAGDLPAALKNHQDSLAIFRRLAAQDPANADLQRNVSIRLDQTAHAQEALKDLPAAQASYQESLAIISKLASQDPANVGWQLGVAYGERNLGDNLYMQERKAEARPHFERFRAAMDARVAEHPEDYVMQVGRAYARWSSADCLDPAAPADRAEARRLLAEAADILHGLEKSPGLQRKHSGWLHDIEDERSKLN